MRTDKLPFRVKIDFNVSVYLRFSFYLHRELFTDVLQKHFQILIVA